eukprot:PhF_6_TR42119/c1_g1_i2/m.63607
MKVSFIIGCLILVVSVIVAQAHQPFHAGPPTNPPHNPLPWPLSHTHQEIQYTVTGLPSKGAKSVYYDFPTLRYRVDSRDLATNFTMQSFWLNDTLYIYTPFGCQKLDMGFGMMKPDWFITNASVVGILWVGKKSEVNSDKLYQVVWRTKEAPDPNPNFEYFSNFQDGTPVMMQAPSPAGYVINEYYNFTVANFTGSAVFDLPATPVCNATSTTMYGDILSKYIHLFTDISIARRH